jgi:hypothetical protein
VGYLNFLFQPCRDPLQYCTVPTTHNPQPATSRGSCRTEARRSALLPLRTPIKPSATESSSPANPPSYDLSLGPRPLPLSSADQAGCPTQRIPQSREPTRGRGQRPAGRSWMRARRAVGRLWCWCVAVNGGLYLADVHGIRTLGSLGVILADYCALYYYFIILLWSLFIFTCIILPRTSIVRAGNASLPLRVIEDPAAPRMEPRCRDTLGSITEPSSPSGRCEQATPAGCNNLLRCNTSRTFLFCSAPLQHGPVPGTEA